MTEAKRKRGRPTVTEKIYKNREFIEQIITDGKDYRSRRTVTDIAYMYAAAEILRESASEIPHFELIDSPKYMCRSILNQLGRMCYQDGYSKADVITIATVAAKARHDGCGVKQIEQYIRNGRRTGEW